MSTQQHKRTSFHRSIPSRYARPESHFIACDKLLSIKIKRLAYQKIYILKLEGLMDEKLNATALANLNDELNGAYSYDALA
jgi:hypothetical protein